MSTSQQGNEIGDPPEPTTEPPELFPGGADAVEDEEKYGAIGEEPLARDLPPSRNAAMVTDDASEEVTEPDEVDDEPTSDGASDPETESPA